MRLFALISVVIVLTGCESARLPLCGDLARTLAEPAQDMPVISKYAQDNAARMHVTLRLLSPFVVVASGTPWQIRRFEAGYPYMLCAFSPANVEVPGETYLRCMGHVLDWIEIVQSTTPKRLMLRETLYEATCASGAPEQAQ